MLDALLRSEGSAPRLPPAAPAARFLAALAEAAGGAPPPLGAVVRVPLPQPLPPRAGQLDWSELRMRRALPGTDQSDVWLRADASELELEVPPELGTGPANAGISLARLLFYLTPRGATSLVASLLLERRVLLVSRSADTVSAAVHAAAALLHPLRWQHIFLPLLPLGLREYLAAPMPYLGEGVGERWQQCWQRCWHCPGRCLVSGQALPAILMEPVVWLCTHRPSPLSPVFASLSWHPGRVSAAAAGAGPG